MTWEPVGAAFQLPYSFCLECAHDAEAFAKNGKSWKNGKSQILDGKTLDLLALDCLPGLLVM